MCAMVAVTSASVVPEPVTDASSELMKSGSCMAASMSALGSEAAAADAGAEAAEVDSSPLAAAEEGAPEGRGASSGYTSKHTNGGQQRDRDRGRGG